MDELASACFDLIVFIIAEGDIKLTVEPLNRIVNPSVWKCRLEEHGTKPVPRRHNDWWSSSFLPFELQFVIFARAGNRPVHANLSTSIR